MTPLPFRGGAGGGDVERKEPTSLKDRATSMRTNQTRAERRLWAMVCGSRLAGLKFRRQAVIDHFIVDFLCPALALVVEVDGASHTNPDRDARRDKRLTSLGYTVLRFTNMQVLEHGDMVAKAIVDCAVGLPARWAGGPHNQRHEAALLNAPTPGPSPEGEGS